MSLLPENTSEQDFITYVNSLVNYYTSKLLWKPESPLVKQVTQHSNNAAAIAEVINY